jgi:hypothetical protein
LAIGDVEEILGDLLRSREVNFDKGMRLFDIDRMFDFLSTHYSEFVTGIDVFDKRHIVPSRGSVFLDLAPTGFGKTWGLIHKGKHALMQRKRVLHISLEMPEEQVAQRYIQSLFSIPKHPAKTFLSTLLFDKRGRLNGFDRDVIIPKITFDDKDVRRRVLAKLKPFINRLPIVIKRFPPRSLSMNQLRAFLDTLEATEGFIPDMIILDYIGIAKTDVKNHRIELGRLMEDFRAICIERNAAGATAAQTSRASMDARQVKAQHVGEDISLIQTADVAVTYSQTPAEKKLNLARLFVSKSRAEDDKFGAIITQSYQLGQYALESAYLDYHYYDHLDDFKTAEKVREDEEEDDDVD